MSTFVAFFVRSTKQDLIDDLINVHGFKTGNEIYTSEIDHDLRKSDKLPNRLAVSSTQADWTTVFYNSSSKLEVWAINLSSELKTQVIVVLGQSVSDYYYFALYDNGKKKREIEVCYSEDFDAINLGKPFEFEEAEPGIKTDHGYLFDMDAIQKYCSQFGLDIFHEPENAKVWTEMKKGWF